MIDIEKAKEAIKDYCGGKGIRYEDVLDKEAVFGDGFIGFFVINPDAPKSDGLKNDAETLMLPILYVKENGGVLSVEETAHTKRYLGE